MVYSWGWGRAGDGCPETAGANRSSGITFDQRFSNFPSVDILATLLHDIFSVTIHITTPLFSDFWHRPVHQTYRPIYANMQRALASRTRASILPSTSTYSGSLSRIRPATVTATSIQQQRFAHKVSSIVTGNWAFSCSSLELIREASSLYSGPALTIEHRILNSA